MAVHPKRRSGQAAKHGRIDRVRDAEAARLRALRFSFAQIAEQLGYADHSGAVRAVERGLARSVREPHQDLIALDMAELDEMAREAWRVLRGVHYVVDRGQVVHLDGEPLKDDAPVLAAISRLLDIQTRRSKLVGLDAPTKARVEVITESAVDAAIRELEGKLGRQSPTVSRARELVAA